MTGLTPSNERRYHLKTTVSMNIKNKEKKTNQILEALDSQIQPLIPSNSSNICISPHMPQWLTIYM
jgi:hypothetical protein